MADYDCRPDKLHEYAGRIARYLEHAKKAAHLSEFPDYRHGAVLVKGGSVINTSNNKSGYCAFGMRFRKKDQGKATVHAELGAILGVDKRLTQGATLYVARIGKQGAYRPSQPCSMCMAAMRYVGIKRVVFTINSKIAGSYKL
jgi:tRNA(Arg) A34 adenosine deaminase TadA